MVWDQSERVIHLDIHRTFDQHTLSSSVFGEWWLSLEFKKWKVQVFKAISLLQNLFAKTFQLRFHALRHAFRMFPGNFGILDRNLFSESAFVTDRIYIR